MLLIWDFELVFVMMEIPNHPPRTILLLSTKKKERVSQKSKRYPNLSRVDGMKGRKILTSLQVF